MRKRELNMKILLTVTLLFFLSANSLAQENLSQTSIYQINGSWQDQNAEGFEITDLLGKKQVLSMIYTSCQHVCPVIVSSMKKIDQLLPEANKDEVGFVLVSFTPDFDTHEILMGYAKKHQLDLDRWTLLRTGSEKVREMAMLLGIKYQLLDNNEVNHSNLISVLDETGTLLFQESGDLSHAKVIAQKLNSSP